MNTYAFQGTFTYIVQAESQSDAEERLNEELGEVLIDWRIEHVS